MRFNAARGSYGPGEPDEFVATRLESFVNDLEPVRVRLHTTGTVIEIRSAHMPDGGIVTTYTDITATVEAEEALERANETLERRVRERTEELMRLNEELGAAKAQADEANISKTRFLAAASHDILQPLNAARLYATSLVERDRQHGDGRLAENVDASLEAVEEILTALLDISRLDCGAMKAEISSFRIEDILNQLKLEFAPVAQEKGLELDLRALHADGPLGPPPAASAAAEPCLERHQVHASRARCWWVAVADGASCASRSGTPASAFRRPSRRRCSASSSGSTRAHARRAASGSACRSSSASRGARPPDPPAIASRQGLRVFRGARDGRSPAGHGLAGEQRRAKAAAASGGHDDPVHRQRAQHPRRHAHAAQRLGLHRAYGRRASRRRNRP